MAAVLIQKILTTGKVIESQAVTTWGTGRQAHSRSDMAPREILGIKKPEEEGGGYTLPPPPPRRTQGGGLTPPPLPAQKIPL